MSAVSHAFLKLTSTKSSKDITGESKVAGYEQQIELSDWTWNLAWDKTEHKPEFKTLNFGKLMDRATTPMLAAMVAGEFLTAVITMEDASKQGIKLVFTLRNVQIVNYDLKAATKEKDGSIDEDWKIIYDSLKFSYKATANEGAIDVPLKRPPGPMKESTDTTAEKMKAAARGVPLEKIDEIWKTVRGELGKEKAPPTPPDTPKK